MWPSCQEGNFKPFISNSKGTHGTFYIHQIWENLEIQISRAMTHSKSINRLLVTISIFFHSYFVVISHLHFVFISSICTAHHLFLASILFMSHVS